MMDKPNFICIIADDLGYGDAGFQDPCMYDVNTPGLNRLASAGYVFDTAYSTSPICSPSRTGIITGRYQQRWGNYWFGQGGLPFTEATTPGILRDKGYHTFKIGKTHYNGGDAEHPLDHGYDSFYGFVDHTADYMRQTKTDVEKYGQSNAEKAHIGVLMRGRTQVYESGYTTELFTNEAVNILSNYQKKAPFFMEIAYNAVHQPVYINHPDYLERFGLTQFPQWEPDVEDYNTWHAKWGLRGIVDPDGRKRYLSTLAVLDDCIRRLLTTLKTCELLENTIIFFLSDNGGAYENYACNAKLKGGKYTLFEGGIRVPLIVSIGSNIQKSVTAAAINGSKRIAETVSTMDILPTILNLAGVEIPGNLDGRSLVPLLKGEASNTPLHPFLIWDNGNVKNNEHEYAVRKGNWKLVHSIMDDYKAIRLNTYCGSVKNVSWKTRTINGLDFYDLDWRDHHGLRLYNLQDDIGESNDVYSEHPEIAKDLINTYIEWCEHL
ncbi:MAG TPA: hypothetical protein DCY35_09505 [Prolixibacteraceae bacterium]|nr:hypothetical protein [Prolixibacteraceae bacterium]